MSHKTAPNVRVLSLSVTQLSRSTSIACSSVSRSEVLKVLGTVKYAMSTRRCSWENAGLSCIDVIAIPVRRRASSGAFPQQTSTPLRLHILPKNVPLFSQSSKQLALQRQGPIASKSSMPPNAASSGEAACAWPPLAAKQAKNSGYKIGHWPWHNKRHCIWGRSGSKCQLY